VTKYILESAPLFEMLSNSIHRIYSSYCIAGDKGIATFIIYDLVHEQKNYVVCTMTRKYYEEALKFMPFNISSKYLPKLVRHDYYPVIGHGK